MLSRADAAARGVHDVVRQHYNAVPQRGREWRKTDSKIKGLRSFNNWVKSVLIQKFSSSKDHQLGATQTSRCDSRGPEYHLKVLDLGCGKGGDLQKWNSAPQRVELYVGLDPAEVSIEQARERYEGMRRQAGRARHHGNDLFHAEFIVKDCFGEWLGTVPIVQQVGINGSVGLDGKTAQPWIAGGFDIVSMMFCMHYAFESEEKARIMLRNVAGSLKKGGRLVGVIPNSDVLTAKVEEHVARTRRSLRGAKSRESLMGEDDDEDEWDPEKTLDAEPVEAEAEEGEVKPGDEVLEWGNAIYKVKFPGKLPTDGVFRPPFGWKYFYFMEEAVEEIPEYVVPWEAFRA